MKKTGRVRFFFSNAGYSYDPKTETPLQGRWKCAHALADAEYEAWGKGYSFHWEVDSDITSADWRDDCEPYATWWCACRNPDGEIVATLGGVDFGPDGEPWGNDYARVVEAELAFEAIHATH